MRTRNCERAYLTDVCVCEHFLKPGPKKLILETTPPILIKIKSNQINIRLIGKIPQLTQTSAVLRLLGALGQINTWGPLLPFPVHFLSLYSSVPSTTNLIASRAGLLIAVAPRYRYCSGATFTVAVAPLLLAESSGDSSAATFLAPFLALFATATFKKEN